MTTIGPKILLEGASGNGKTRSIGTLVDWAAAQKPEPWPVRVLFTEVGSETLLGYWRDRNLPIPANLDIATVTATDFDLSQLLADAKLVGGLDQKGLAGMAKVPNKVNYYHRILSALADFPGELSGKSLGNCKDWPLKSFLVIDGLSELSQAAFDAVVGKRLATDKPDFGTSQRLLFSLLRGLTQGLPCGLVLLAHIDRLVDEISKVEKVMTKSIGKAMAADITRLFGDVILAKRDGSTFTWDTFDSGADLKARNLAYQPKQPPNFAPLLDTWTKRMLQPAAAT